MPPASFWRKALRWMRPPGKETEQQDIMVLATEEPVFEAALWVWQQMQEKCMEYKTNCYAAGLGTGT